MLPNRVLANMFKKYITFNNNSCTPALGRWSTHESEEVKSRRILLANIDSCGDEICSNPSQLKDKFGYYNTYNEPVSSVGEKN